MSDPAFEVRSGKGPNGLYRETRIPDKFSLIGEIEAFRNRVGERREGPWSILDGPYGGLQDALTGGPRPCDRFILNPHRFTEPAAIEKARAHGQEDLQNRIVVNAHVTGAGNLSVRFAPNHLDEDGLWRPAPEWKELTPPYHEGYGERPLFELLFVRGVDELVGAAPLGPTDDWALARSLASQAVTAAYREAVYSLYRSFVVQENCHVVALFADEKAAWGWSGPYDPGNCLGIEIVDGYAEHRAALARVPIRFAEATGIEMRALWQARNELDDPHAYKAPDKLSRLLRKRGTKSADLTPGVVRDWLAEMDKAERYGVLDLSIAVELPDDGADPAPGP